MNREMRRKSARNKNAGKQALEAFQERQKAAIWVNSAVNDTFLLLSFILHDKFGFGKGRLDKIRYECTRLKDAMESGYINFDDIEDVIKDEVYGGNFTPLETVIVKGA